MIFALQRKTFRWFDLIVLGLGLWASQGLFAGEVLLDDAFDDGSIGSNRNGVGSGWLSKGAASLVEEDGVATFSLDRFGNAWISAKEADAFNFWDDDGVTVTFRVKENNVPAPHLYTGQIVWWNFSVVSANMPNDSWRNIDPDMGGMVIHLGFRDNRSRPLVGAIEFHSKNQTGDSHDGFTDGYKWLPFSMTEYTPPGPIVIKLKLNKRGWEVIFDTPTTGNLSGNWTTDLGPAAITDEFQNGASVFLFWRTGTSTDGIGEAYPNGPNSGLVESIKVERNSSL